MESSDDPKKPEALPATTSAPEGGRFEGQLEPAQPGSPPPRSLPLAAMALGAGLLAGFASWLVGEGVLYAFKPPLFQYEMMGQTLLKAKFEDQVLADSRNATLAFALLGGALGLALGVAGGLARGSTRGGIRAGALGLMLGLVLGGGSSLVILPAYDRALSRSPEEMSHAVILPMLVHAGIWSACGVAGGIALGVGLEAGRSRLVNAALGGLIGAAIGAVLYEILGLMLFPSDRTTSPLSSAWYTRLIARLLVGGLAGSVASSTGQRGAGDRPTPARDGGLESGVSG
ncbi:hypothetical protein EP7_000965 [Isosphaeraceae bacterium EP7]